MAAPVYQPDTHRAFDSAARMGECARTWFVNGARDRRLGRYRPPTRDTVPGRLARFAYDQGWGA